MGVDDIVTKIFCEDLGPRLSEYRKWGIQTPLMSSVFMIHQPKAGLRTLRIKPEGRQGEHMVGSGLTRWTPSGEQNTE